VDFLYARFGVAFSESTPQTPPAEPRTACPALVFYFSFVNAEALNLHIPLAKTPHPVKKYHNNESLTDTPCMVSITTRSSV
jgi:hypothetical protein